MIIITATSNIIHQAYHNFAILSLPFSQYSIILLPPILFKILIYGILNCSFFAQTA